ncbi:hypothetical protein [Tepidiforma sp.]|jgi:hypothetical protein|uniref:hypothetical protein n=1 Tax=Tepidiforma sp. TaxID=2682230 RepID=UPI00260A02CA|nr:hypothetical protein [Tepidiforma sp.]MCX7617195.1 hypothetical protein [Tepidiforma sp.]
MFAAALLCLALAAPACRGGAPARSETVPLPDAYRSMLDEVAEVRGLAPPASLRIGVVRREALPGLLADAAAPGDAAFATERSTVYRLLGLLPPGTDSAAAERAMLESAAGALYLPGRREVWLIRDGALPASPAGLEPWEQRLLAHEFVHALQDFHFDILRLERGAATLDARLALRALLEGDASWTEGQWTSRYLLPGLAPGAAVEPPPAAAAPPPALAREAAFQYTTGTEWVSLLRGTDPGAVDRLLRAGGPGATALILHPELERTGWAPGGAALPAEPPAPGWALNSTSTLGEFLLASYLQTGLPALAALQAAAGWAADALTTFEAPGGAALALRIRFSDAKEAGEFAVRHRGLLEARAPAVREEPGQLVATRRDGVTAIQLEPDGAAVTLVFADTEADARALAAFLRNL